MGGNLELVEAPRWVEFLYIRDSIRGKRDWDSWLQTRHLAIAIGSAGTRRCTLVARTRDDEKTACGFGSWQRDFGPFFFKFRFRPRRHFRRQCAPTAANRAHGQTHDLWLRGKDGKKRWLSQELGDPLRYVTENRYG